MLAFLGLVYTNAAAVNVSRTKGPKLFGLNFNSQFYTERERGRVTYSVQDT